MKSERLASIPALICASSSLAQMTLTDAFGYADALACWQQGMLACDRDTVFLDDMTPGGRASIGPWCYPSTLSCSEADCIAGFDPGGGTGFAVAMSSEEHAAKTLCGAAPCVQLSHAGSEGRVTLVYDIDFRRCAWWECSFDVTISGTDGSVSWSYANFHSDGCTSSCSISVSGVLDSPLANQFFDVRLVSVALADEVGSVATHAAVMLALCSLSASRIGSAMVMSTLTTSSHSWMTTRMRMRMRTSMGTRTLTLTTTLST